MSVARQPHKAHNNVRRYKFYVLAAYKDYCFGEFISLHRKPLSRCCHHPAAATERKSVFLKVRYIDADRVSAGNIWIEGTLDHSTNTIYKDSTTFYFNSNIVSIVEVCT